MSGSTQEQKDTSGPLTKLDLWKALLRMIEKEKLSITDVHVLPTDKAELRVTLVLSKVSGST